MRHGKRGSEEREEKTRAMDTRTQEDRFGKRHAAFRSRCLVGSSGPVGPGLSRSVKTPAAGLDSARRCRAMSPGQAIRLIRASPPSSPGPSPKPLSVSTQLAISSNERVESRNQVAALVVIFREIEHKRQGLFVSNQ